MPPEELEAFSLPDPQPEDRDYYWEFGEIHPGRRRRCLYETEYERLRTELQSAHDSSRLPEAPTAETRAALNDLLIRTRTRGL